MREQYIGDGVYASYDGYAIKIRADRDGRDHWIVLEPDVLVSLVLYAEKMKKAEK